MIPISNAEIERTFFSFSYLKNKLRNNLDNEHLDQQLFIYKSEITQKNVNEEFLESSI